MKQLEGHVVREELYKQNNSLPKVKENRHKMNVYSGP
jgi:hypothetical protein